MEKRPPYIKVSRNCNYVKDFPQPGKPHSVLVLVETIASRRGKFRLKVYITRPENTVRWRSQEGDIAFWDNRAMERYAIADYGDRPRQVQRVTITGDIPVNIDGKHSQAIKGSS